METNQIKNHSGGLTLKKEQLATLSKSVEAPPAILKNAIQDMLSLGLIEQISEVDNQSALPFKVAASSYCRVKSDLQAYILSAILGYKLTEFAQIVKASVLSEDEPVIAGTRIPVYSIIIALMNGSGIGQIQKRYPEVPRQAILDAIHYYLHHQNQFDERLKSEVEHLTYSQV